jgi:hypothetical protein
LRPAVLILLAACSMLQPARAGTGADEPAPATAQAVCPIMIGQALPRLTLNDLEGAAFDLNAAAAEKPTILIFYRGGW